MTSKRKIAANRSNSHKSCGPRSAAGKNRASRNAMRHGLAALLHRQPVPSTEVEQLTSEICGGDEDPWLREHAAIIAESALVLKAVQSQKSALVDRLKECGVAAIAAGDNGLARAELRQLQSELALEQLPVLCAGVLERYKDRLAPAIQGEAIQPNGCLIGDFIPLQLKLLDEYATAEESMREAHDTRSCRVDQASKLLKERNEREALLEALPDLIRLDRYERRAWSRQKLAIRKFMRVKLTRELGIGSAGVTVKGKVTDTENSPALQAAQ